MLFALFGTAFIFVGAALLFCGYGLSGLFAVFFGLMAFNMLFGDIFQLNDRIEKLENKLKGDDDEETQ